MFVIADIEWIGGLNNKIIPTQIAAAKVDADWNIIRSFHSCTSIKPFNYSSESVSLNGYSEENFQKAESPDIIINNFCRWLEDDDILCWWVDSSERAFKIITHKYLNRNSQWQHRIISLQIKNELENAGISSPGLYGTGKILDVNNNLIPHFSTDDVELLIRILKKLNIKSDSFKQRLSEPIEEKKVIRNLSYDMVLSGYISPTEYNRFILNKRKDIAYIRASDSDIFHRADCHLPIRSRNLEMYIRFQSCLKKGLKPCKCCCPTKSNEKLQPGKKKHSRRLRKEIDLGYKFYNKPGVTLSDLTGRHYDVPQRTLSKPEKAAVKRYLSAKKARSIISGNNNLTKQEKVDLLTLSRTDCCFWSGRGYGTFHLRNCTKLKDLTDIVGFSCMSQAIHEGYRPCKICKPSNKHDIELTMPYFTKPIPNESIDLIKDKCNKIGIHFTIVDKCAELETDYGIWQIDCGSIPYRLYHINKVYDPDNTEDFHQQPHIFLSLTDVLAYIIGHDKKLEKDYGKSTLFQISGMLKKLKT